MKIHIMGDSSACSTTLRHVLEGETDIPYFDTDDYFWMRSQPPFTLRRDPLERNRMLLDDLAKEDHFIVGGSIIQWGATWLTMFDLVIFLYVPRTIRMQRLNEREEKRYGDRLVTDPILAEKYNSFIRWAYGYDDDTTSGRNLSAHRAWLSRLECPVLEISGDTSVAERLTRIKQVISSGHWVQR